MAKYCCFICPSQDYSEKELSGRCPSCGRAYGFVLEDYPAQIQQYQILAELDRGFYGVAYVGEKLSFRKKYVLKVSPVSFYDYKPFSKLPFDEEVALHAELAQNASHVVGIVDALTERVLFRDSEKTEVLCNVTVLDYVEGPLLRDFLSGKIKTSAATVCQIAVDLLLMRAEFEKHRLNHNDLHADNIVVEKLRPEARRRDALDDSIKLKAIDLGSLSGESRSTEQRLGDLAHIAAHIDGLLTHFLSNPSEVDDRDFRIALALQEIIHGLRSEPLNTRVPNADDLIQQIEETYSRTTYPWRPWRNPLRLKGFADHYNALTLESWNVPRLLVDPQDRWVTQITTPGPQIITGMRGCGKTMLLRALDIHARAAMRDGELGSHVVNRIRRDGFVGLFVSAQKLLDLREQSLLKIEYRLTRLFVAYALQAARAMLHVKDVDASVLTPRAHASIGAAVADLVPKSDELRRVVSLEDLEQQLQRILVLTMRGDERYRMDQSPSEAFIYFAEQFRACSEIFSQSSIFYLLDDVSTRYLELEKIEAILSKLLFQNPICAFKFTSEWQTIELGLKSPGRNHPIRVDRDLTVFDLGADVFKTISAHGNKGKRFVESILQLRANLQPGHPMHVKPKEVLGDVPLATVAKEIASSNETSGQKKRVYRGLSCLTNVCVGDIGDVIKLYEEILRRAGNTRWPIPAEVQSECFREISTLRLYDLNRRSGYFKAHALAFGEVAHDLLVRSFRTEEYRIRQFSSIYVRVTSDDERTKKQQIDGLRELIDAGVFVFSGGAPRTKTKDSNPIQQFILSFRKIYGLTAFIGLGDRDRFELSGGDLEDWLEKPSMAKEILLRNQIEDDLDSVALVEGTEEEDEDGSPEVILSDVDASEERPRQVELFSEDLSRASGRSGRRARARAKEVACVVREISAEELSHVSANVVLTALGFEDRAVASNRLLATICRPKVVFALRYSLDGRPGMAEVWRDAGSWVQDVTYAQALLEIPSMEGLWMVDISGLAKPFIFNAIRRELATKGRVLVCHAEAEDQYPLREEVENLLAVERLNEPVVFLERLAKVLMGEKGPYKEIRLLEEESDPSRARALIAFASAKHERLFTLLDMREFDRIEVVAPVGSDPRARVAGLAAEFVCRSYPNSRVGKVDPCDLLNILEYLDEHYLDLYSNGGANVEIGLTGSKLQAVAAAILSARRKVSQAWYLRPAEFDPKRFSSGVGRTRIFDIRTPVPNGK